MEIRHAKADDARRIAEMINYHAERGRMLHRSLESVYENLREFQVVEDDGRIIGCVAVGLFWSDLAEVKSLAVDPAEQGRGVGAELLQAAIADARRLGLKRLFALTYETGFFQRAGFRTIDRGTLPEKVWRECVACPKADHCDEIAMILMLDETSGGR
ncbi:MAG: N-acetyltransferase [Phycisphaerae bacterium]